MAASAAPAEPPEPPEPLVPPLPLVPPVPPAPPVPLVPPDWVPESGCFLADDSSEPPQPIKVRHKALTQAAVGRRARYFMGLPLAYSAASRQLSLGACACGRQGTTVLVARAQSRWALRPAAPPSSVCSPSWAAKGAARPSRKNALEEPASSDGP